MNCGKTYQHGYIIIACNSFLIIFIHGINVTNTFDLIVSITFLKIRFSDIDTMVWKKTIKWLT